MNLNLNDLAEDVRKLNALVDSHIGNRDSAHAVATFEQNGFMSSDDKNNIDMRGRYASSVGSGATILNFKAGLYVGVNFTDAPSEVDGSVCIVDITGASQGEYKVIKFYWVNGSKVFWRFIYTASTGSVSDSNWLNEGFQSVTPLNGGSGYITVNRFFNGAVFELALRIDINISISTTSPVGIAVLPAGYTTLDSNADYFNGIGVDSSGANVPIGIVITGGNTVSAFRTDSSSNSISKIRAYIQMICQDSHAS